MTILGDIALVLVGHGSTRRPDAAAPVLGLAADIRRRGIFAEVEAVFMKQEPAARPATELAASATIVVVPVFAGQGHYTDTLIPQGLDLDGPVTHRHGRTILTTTAVGTHPSIPGLLARRAERVALAAGMAPTAHSLLLIAHGSARPGGAGATPRAIAAAMASMERFAEVTVAFLEQEPRAAEWRALVHRPDIVALPLLIAQGMHASFDIPPLFGLGPDESGPIVLDDHRVVLATGLGHEPDLVEVIIGMVEDTLAQKANTNP
jgi:sirohydrochlorin cobaltochelatase